MSEGTYNISVKVTLIAKSLLSVGCGKVAAKHYVDIVLYQRPVLVEVKDGYGQRYEYCIPGSTLKGVLRTSASKVARLLGLASCYEISPDKTCGRCDVCDVFGAPDKPSKIFVGDATPSSSLSSTSITHTSINRKRRVVERWALFSVETYPIGSSFHFEISCRGLPLKHIKLLLVALANMRYMRFGRGSYVHVQAEVEGKLPEDGFIKFGGEVLRKPWHL